jgi:folate-binding protein YgfZ
MTAKGRMAGEIFISLEPDALIIDAEPELRESLIARLERYIISDDVTLEDVTDELALLHVFGMEREQLVALENVRAARRYGRVGQDILLPRKELLKESEMSPELLETIRIEAGVPRWGRELSEETLPPEAGLDRTHIDYHKGCYIGQEVISRLKSVGHVNRQLTGFVALSDAPLIAGSQVFAVADPGKALGELTSVCFSFALDKSIALGYLKRGSPTGELLARASGAGGAEVPVTTHALPFTA